LPPAFDRYRPELEEELRVVIGNKSSPLYNMMRYHLGWVDEQGNPQEGMGGKLLRPTLCLLACETVGGDWRAALPAAAALELVHNFSLIHDDIQDESEERRHRLTLWRRWGKPQAINAGDAMYALSRLALYRLRERGVPDGKVLHVAHILDEACLRLCEGQYLDLSYEDRLDIDVDDYLEMIEGKAAALIECSLHIGALLGTENQSLIGHFQRFGKMLGLAYQIRDDVLGIWGKKKAHDTDIKKRKKTFPVIYALGRAEGKQREKLLTIYQKGISEEGEVFEVIKALDSLGPQKYAQKMAEHYYLGSLEELRAMNLPAQAEDELRMIAAFFVERDY